MGTENVAPLLYSLARTTRARRILEIGAGYSTPFLLRALLDNLDDFRCERDQLAEKTARYHAAARPSETPQEILAALTHWELQPPPLADPAYYREPFQPALHSFDTAGSALNMEKLLGAPAKILTLHHRDFAGASNQIDKAHLPFDLAWMDCGGLREYQNFLKEYWDLVSENGGLIVLHYTLNNPWLAHIVKDLKLKQATTHFHNFELLSLLEPHKYRQNSCTIVRKISRCVDDFERATRPIRALSSDHEVGEI